ncbi:unnamed protein product [Dovyalis caffra]|uniref:F-box protein n=1 Tax=Dovyalis caffra TaxID=77055 RepID=A0AAV1RX44_9ROSI|nr:unnamed protein product [Dovyalis caffra]
MAGESKRRTEEWLVSELPPDWIMDILSRVHNHSQSFDFIDAFEFDTEQFKQLSLRPPPLIRYDGFLSVGVLQGCLSVAFSVSHEFGNLEIWFDVAKGEELNVSSSQVQPFKKHLPEIYLIEVLPSEEAGASVLHVHEGTRGDFQVFPVQEFYVGLLGQLYEADEVFWGTSCVEPLIMAALLMLSYFFDLLLFISSSTTPIGVSAFVFR